MTKTMKRVMILLWIIGLVFSNSLVAMADSPQGKISKIDEYIAKNFDGLKTPGMSVGIIIDGEVHYLNYGYGDLENKTSVSANTNFEIGSVTKSFTALGITKLEDEGKLDFNDPVTKYFPEFKLEYKGTPYEITINQLLHHTSGIGTDTVRLFREDASDAALENIVKTVSGTGLASIPGSEFEYATVNYDILGAIIEQVSGVKYEEFIKTEILNELGMENSYVGMKENDENLATGYKISFFKARPYDAPVFRSNYPAGYVVSNAEDMIKWVSFQMGLSNNPELGSLRDVIFQPNKNVESENGTFYSKGWFHVLNRHDEVTHGGLNPNFISHVSFSKDKNSGIVMLANSNSANFNELAGNITNYLYGGGKLAGLDNKAGGMDTALSVAIIVSIVVTLLLIALWGFVFWEYKKGKRTFGLAQGDLKKLVSFIVGSLPVFFGIYLFPRAFTGTDWYTAVLWGPETFMTAVKCIIGLILLSFITYLILLLYPSKNFYVKEAPEVITLSLLSGISNAIIILLITSSLGGVENLQYILYYFLVAAYIYILGRRTLEVRLAIIAQSAIRGLRETIFDKLFATNYDEFEKMESGKLMATLTDDINQIAGVTGLIVVFTTSIVTIVAAFSYLATISALATLMALVVIFGVATVYGMFMANVRSNIENARETQNSFMGKIEGLINGFKDLSQQRKKKQQYKDEIKDINIEFMNSNIAAFRKFINAAIFGESLFIIVLGAIVFGFSYIEGLLTTAELISFVLILLYILGPINGVINAMPRIMQARVAIGRVKQLINQLPERAKNEETVVVDETIGAFAVEKLTYQYEDRDDMPGFKVDNINLNVKKGEILFIIGGNGSGKSTLLKLVTGLYKPHKGGVKVNGKETDSSIVGEYISSVFTDSYLFKRIYNSDLTGKEMLIKDYLKQLDLDKKVSIENGHFSTTNLSTGQKKRLHLLRCYLENKPVYIFDEIAADQDPNFRKFFYRTLLPEMREQGKIIIAVTHDDHYFDVADKIVKLDMGKMDDISQEHILAKMDIS